MEHSLPIKHQMALNFQRWLSYINLLWFGPLFFFLLRFVGGYRCHNRKLLRKKVQDLLKEVEHQPVVICANHLTMIDSMLIGSYLFSMRSFMSQLNRFPWNVPEIANFGKNLPLKIMCYLGRCVFVERQGSVASKKLTWQRIKFLTEKKNYVCIFPEGGRARSGRIEPENAVYGVGHIVQEVEGCAVLCVYLRGRQQETYGFYPHKGDVFDVDVRLVQPRSSSSGRRGAREITRKVMAELKDMEDQYFLSRDRD